MAPTQTFPWRTGSVALVGSAQSLENSDFGPAIDAHDLVIRINQGAFAHLQAHNTGVRTDYLFMTLTGGTHSAKWSFIRRGQKAAKRGVVLMSSKGRTLFRIDLTPFFLHYPRQWHEELIDHLGHRPSTGAMAIDLLTRTMSDPESLDVYGFDFFKTPDIAHGRNNVVAHDPGVEEAYIRGLIPAHRFHESPQSPIDPVA
jgi:hypothetical protein